tara:strand:+ start:323 stop:526 length:204 start_codon:yes stop_codon:yes gene_type:complete
VRQKVKVGNLVRLKIWNQPEEADLVYGIVTAVKEDRRDLNEFERYYVMSSDGVWLYDWNEIDELICD